jgi:uncharacterized membrane protein
MPEPMAPPPLLTPEPPHPVGLPPNVAACLACVFPLFGGLILINVERRHAFVRFYAMQSVYFGGASVVAYVVYRVGSMIANGIPILGSLLGWIVSLAGVLLAIVWLATYVVLVMKSISGREWEVPYLGRLARLQLTSEER